MRTAQAHHDRDVAAGRVLTEPAERVVERVVQPRHPTTTAAWVTMLDALAEQLRTGAIGPWDHDRIRHALAGVHTALGDQLVDVDRADAAAVPLLPADQVQEMVDLLAATSAGTGTATTLTRLAGELGGVDVEHLRAVLAALVDAGAATLTRPDHPDPVDPDRLVDHNRFVITLTG